MKAPHVYIVSKTAPPWAIFMSQPSFTQNLFGVIHDNDHDSLIPNTATRNQKAGVHERQE